jgi:hypothetical protein
MKAGDKVTLDSRVPFPNVVALYDNLPVIGKVYEIESSLNGEVTLIGIVNDDDQRFPMALFKSFPPIKCPPKPKQGELF